MSVKTTKTAALDDLAEEYDDKQSAAVISEEKDALGGIINQADSLNDMQIQATKDYADKQTEIQNQQTDLVVQQLEQNKAQAEKDYIKEKSSAYTDFQKQSNQYGVDAEVKAASGMKNTGYTESSRVAMYNQYQQRAAVAREAYVLAKQNYDTKIAEARLQNSSVLAKIAYESYQQQLSLALDGFNNKNQLIIAKKEDNKNNTDRWQEIIEQIDKEDSKKTETSKSSKFGKVFNGAVKKITNGQSSDLAPVLSKTGKGVLRALPNSNATSKNETLAPTELKPDMASVRALIRELGTGPISAAKLDELISAGIVQEYVEDGKLKFRLLSKP